MNAELLSRLQFGLTASFHFIYPPLSMGLGLMLVVIGIMYVRTKDPKWRRLSFFWMSHSRTSIKSCGKNTGLN